MAQSGREDDLVVLLGTPNPESSRLYGITVTQGDPSWAGPLAGLPLNLPVYHVTEPEIKDQIDPQVYDDHIGLAELAMDVDAIAAALHQVRSEAGQ